MKLNAMMILAAVMAFNVASAEALKLDEKSSVLNWKGTKITGASHVGEIRLKSGSLDVEKGQIKAGSFVVDMSSMTNNDLKDSPEYQAKLLNHLKSDDFFDVQKYPESTFVIEKVVPGKAAGESIVSGSLTLKGKTASLSFPAKIKIENGVATAEGTLTFDRTQWDLKYGSNKFFQNLGDKVIKDDIEIALKLEAKADAPAAAQAKEAAKGIKKAKAKK
jgi:polyisoprenoid-binding protein YceI